MHSSLRRTIPTNGPRCCSARWIRRSCGWSGRTRAISRSNTSTLPNQPLLYSRGFANSPKDPRHCRRCLCRRSSTRARTITLLNSVYVEAPRGLCIIKVPDISHHGANALRVARNLDTTKTSIRQHPRGFRRSKPVDVPGELVVELAVRQARRQIQRRVNVFCLPEPGWTFGDRETRRVALVDYQRTLIENEVLDGVAFRFASE